MEGGMSFTNWLFGSEKSTSNSASTANHSKLGFPSSQTSTNSVESPQAVRKELLRLVLRETLKYNGFPGTWVTADALVATSSRRESGIHVRLVIKHWDARFPQYAVAFQHNFESRLLTLDPLAGNWLMGISWQYDLPMDAQWPDLPAPGSWSEAVAPPEVDMIPQAIVVTVSRTREELEREMADEDKRFRGSQNDFEATQAFEAGTAAAYSPTKPSPLR
jgi:hypothetical protein